MKSDPGQQQLRSRQRRQRKVLIGLGLVLAAVGSTRLLRGPSEHAEARSSGQATPPTALVDDRPAASAAAAFEPTWPDGLQRDVFHLLVELDPPTVTVSATSNTTDRPDPAKLLHQARLDLNVQGISFGRKTQVVINGRACHVGDSVSGYTIRTIRPELLTVERHGITIELPFQPLY
jgi:hypothetical protein